MLAKGQLDDAISCSLRAIELNRNIPKAERDVEGRYALRVSILARAACPRACRGPSNVSQNRNRRTTVAVRTSTTPVLATSLARKQGQFRPLRATLPQNHDQRSAATPTLAWRDGLSGFRTCLRASVGSTEASRKHLRG